MSVSRVKSKAICYLGPLPDDLPKPAYLKAELQGVCIVKRIRRTVLPNVTAEKKRFANLMSCSVLVPVSSPFLYPVHGSCHTGIKSASNKHPGKCLQNALKSLISSRSHKVTSCASAWISTFSNMFKGALVLMQVFWFSAIPSPSLSGQSHCPEVLGSIRTGRQNSSQTRSARILWPIPNLSLARSWPQFY